MEYDVKNCPLNVLLQTMLV